MSDLSAAAAALGIPEAIVQRSAAARAAETGTTVDEVLAAWAGGGSVAASPVSSPESEATLEEVDRPEAETEEAPESETVEDAPPSPPPAELPPSGGEIPSGPVTRSPIPAEVTAAEAAGLPEVITVPTAGIRERTNLVIPRWLAAVMLIIPAFALFALGGSATGECGENTELATNVITGQVVNCDGTEFTGSGAGGGGGDFIAMGEDVYLNTASCDGCHGASGQGGVGPSFSGVVTTFGSCADHIEWVTLGSQGFLDAGESTYGDTDKPIAGGMPSFGSTLTEEQLAAVVAFERVRFGGADPTVTLTDCGLAPAEGEEGEAPGETTPGEEPPAEGETTTTVSGAEAAIARLP
jgi:Cytochrome C oxidase, cbb3-type, subunit III